MSTAAPRRVHLFLLVTLVLMGLVAGQHAQASVVCFNSAAVCNVVDEPDVTLGWAPPSSTTPVDHYAVEISWNGGVFELNSNWANISPSSPLLTINTHAVLIGHYFKIRVLACDAQNTCSQPSSESHAIAFYAADDPGAATPDFPGSAVVEEPVNEPVNEPVDEPDSGSADSIFRYERWSTRQSTYWEDQRWFSGDFNGDTRVDVAKAYSDNGLASIDIHRSTGNAFYVGNWADMQGDFPIDQQWFSGDFNGDGFDDVGNAFGGARRSNIDIYTSLGSSFDMSRWMSMRSPFDPEQKWIVGDFNGNGRDDLASVFADNGRTSIDVYLSNGSGFQQRRWATQLGTFYDAQSWFAGDFNGDGRDDLSKVIDINGQIAIDVHSSSGSSFGLKHWNSAAGTYSLQHKWVVGEFNGDGRDDLVKIFEDQQKVSIDAYSSNGSSFTRERWATQQGLFDDSQSWLAGDYNEDGTDDLAVISNDAGKISIDVYR